MANYERGSDDVRVFDGAEDEEDVEGSRLPLLIVIALVVLAAFAAVVWLAYQRGVQQGHAEVPREIAAEPGPAKIAPSNPGGTATPYTGLKIYQQPAGSEEDANNDTAPPDTVPKPAPVAATPAPAAAKPAPPPAMQAEVKPAPAMTPAAKPVPAAIQTPPKPVATTPPPTAVKPTVTPPVATTKPTQLAPKPAPTPSVAPAGGGLLQIGSYKSAADADTAWRAYKAKHTSLVGGLSPDVKQVDLGAKGTWYRLRIVAGSKADASALCTKLKADGGDCILAK